MVRQRKNIGCFFPYVYLRTQIFLVKVSTSLKSFKGLSNFLKLSWFRIKLHALSIITTLDYVNLHSLTILSCITSLIPFALQSKSMDWFLYDNDLHHERVKGDLGTDNQRRVKDTLKHLTWSVLTELVSSCFYNY